MVERVKFIIINELLETSSSDDEIEEKLCVMKEERPKIKNYVNIVNEYSDKEFQRNFRVQRNTYLQLKRLYEESRFCHAPVDDNNNISNDQKLLSFLWFAGNKVCIRDVAGRFEMAESTFHFHSNNIMDFLNDMARSIIKFPNTLEEKTEVSRQFENINGFPGIVGCIDGTYIMIRTSSHKIKLTYVNRHDMPSLTLQAICDANKMFLDVFTGPPSKVHDARVFKLSFISTTLPDTCGDEWHILGDAAYPLKKYLITPCRDYGNLTEEQRNFNYKFSACRVKIENAFGLLKTRFRQLIRLDFNTVRCASKFIIACCALHNLCISNTDYIENFEEDLENIAYMEDNMQDVQEAGRNNDRIAGEEKRNRLCQLLQ